MTRLPSPPPAPDPAPAAARKPGADPATAPVLLVISAPSGGGKTTVCNLLLKSRPNTTRAITCTTREPRPGEKHGTDYYFLDAADFLKRVQAGNFLEHATVFSNSYGTLKSEVLAKLRAGRDVLLNIDVQGAAAIRAHAAGDPELQRALVTVFLAAPSLKILEQRLRKRGQDSAASIQKRLSVARQELAQARNFDYVIVSDSIGRDHQRMEAILDAEKQRQHRVAVPSYD